MRDGYRTHIYIYIYIYGRNKTNTLAIVQINKTSVFSSCSFKTYREGTKIPIAVTFYEACILHNHNHFKRKEFIYILGG